MAKEPHAHQRDTRRKNASALLRDLWHFAPLSKAALAQRNGLTKTTISAICDDLKAQNLIRETGQDRTGPGRPGNLLELNPKARCSIGVEISTNYSAAVLTDLCGGTLWQRTVLTAVGSPREIVLAQAAALIAEAINQTRGHRMPLLGLAVGVPGLVAPGQDSLVTAPAMGWKEVPLKRIWETRFSLPVIVENKARAAAMAEALHGNAQGATSFLYVSIGTDVQSSVEAAVVIDGAPYRGARGLAVDAGHMILDLHGPLCSCGQRGCWQKLADVDREVELIRPRLAAGEPSLLQRYAAEGFATLEHRAIHQAAVEHDALALEVVSSVLMNHALGIANLVRLFDPELVVIGFANVALPPAYQTRMNIMQEMPELDIPEAVRQQLAQRGVTPPTIVFAKYGPDACLVGAAALPVDNFLRTPPTHVA